MSKASTAIAFVVGAAIGSTATWFFVKKKYEQLAQEEIDSVKETFARLYAPKNEEGEQDTAEKKADMAKDKPTVAEYAAKLRNHGYTNYSNSEDEEYTVVAEKEPEKLDEKPYAPYVIPPEQFGDEEEYTQISLTYYADEVLTDDLDKIIHDIEGTVGYESLSHFGEYEDDSVFVRNERLKCDYEILLDQRNYSDVIKESPYKAED